MKKRLSWQRCSSYALYLFLALIAAGVVLTACGGEKNGGNASGSYQAITDAYTARTVVEHIRDAVSGGVVGQLTAGTSTANFTKTVNGDKSGTATIYGYYYLQTCGSGVGSLYTINVDITFNNFGTMGHSANVEKILNGSANYQSGWGCGYSSYSYVRSQLFWGSNASVQIEDVIDGSWGYSDTLTFYGSGDPVSSGWATPGNGVKYTF